IDRPRPDAPPVTMAAFPLSPRMPHSPPVLNPPCASIRQRVPRRRFAPDLAPYLVDEPGAKRPYPVIKRRVENARPRRQLLENLVEPLERSQRLDRELDAHVEASPVLGCRVQRRVPAGETTGSGDVKEVMEDLPVRRSHCTRRRHLHV